MFSVGSPNNLLASSTQAQIQQAMSRRQARWHNVIKDDAAYLSGISPTATSVVIAIIFSFEPPFRPEAMQHLSAPRSFGITCRLIRPYQVTLRNHPTVQSSVPSSIIRLAEHTLTNTRQIQSHAGPGSVDRHVRPSSISLPIVPAAMVCVTVTDAAMVTATAKERFPGHSPLALASMKYSFLKLSIAVYCSAAMSVSISRLLRTGRLNYLYQGVPSLGLTTL
jgi:hypothetical protein